MIDYDALVIALHGTLGRPGYDVLHGPGSVKGGHVHRAHARAQKAVRLIEAGHPAKPHVMAVKSYLATMARDVKGY